MTNGWFFRSLSCAAVLAILQITSVRADLKSVMAEKFFSQRLHQSIPVDSSREAATAKIFYQQIDHNSLKNDVFQQRYFVDSTYANRSDSPVLYYICGESDCVDPSNSQLLNELAQKYQAHLVALEHRYYGRSQPFATLTAEHLKYLSTQQALDDLANFQRYAQKELKMKGKWVAVGGSYAGALAAFYRMKYPDLVVGSIASSGPVFAKANFFEYDEYVSKVAGPKCHAALQESVREVEDLLATPEGSKQVRALFNASRIKLDEDFLYVLADMASIAIQYGYQQRFCDALLKGQKKGKLLEAYAEVGLGLLTDFGLSPDKDAFQAAENTDPDFYLGWFGLRAWLYQSCTEFGFYQVASPDANASSRSARITLDYHNATCDRLFGIKTQVNTRKTNNRYYKKLFHSEVSNIFFTNGDNDPWSVLSLTSDSDDANRNPELVLATIADASHCDDLGRASSLALRQVRLQTIKLVGQWLED